jgi:DNA polymerase III alpha subunit
MGFAVLEDKYDSIEVSIYSATYERYKDKFVTDAFVVIKGGLSEAREGYKIVIREIIDPNSEENQKKAVAELAQTQPKTNVTLWLKMEERSDKVFAKVLDVLDQYPGDIPVKIKIEGKAYTLDQKVRRCSAIEYELAGLLGEKCVVFFEK